MPLQPMSSIGKMFLEEVEHQFQQSEAAPSLSRSMVDPVTTAIVPGLTLDLGLQVSGDKCIATGNKCITTTVTNSFLLLVAMHLLLVASCY